MTPPGIESLSPLFQDQDRATWLRAMAQRAQNRLEEMSEGDLQRHLEETLYFERLRLERAKSETTDIQRADALSKALVRGIRADQMDASLAMVAAWTDEIHGKFSPRVYRMATRVGPKALTALLTARPSRLRGPKLDISRRLVVRGQVAHVRDLIREGTVILAPTHVSNLDSPLIGLSLFLSDLPPFVYGAGLNLFSNPLLGWWLRRLGAYTVDRTKRAPLYKDTLKDYSLHCLTHGFHSLFFPGGTRSRSGALETNLRKGLLGTGITALQYNLQNHPRPNPIYIVPMTLSFQLVLEAPTLIDDHLAEAGKQRYIIDDDEFSQPSEVAGFARRIFELDSSVVVHFGQPLDCFGFPVSPDPAERKQQRAHRKGFITDPHGKIQRDTQRDRMYTNELAKAIVGEYPKGVTVMSTHLAAWAAWRQLCQRFSYDDPFRLVRTAPGQRRIARSKLLAEIDNGVERVRRLNLHHTLAASSESILEEALDRFNRYHKTRALRALGSDICVEDPRLCLYYRNRLLQLDGVG